MSAIQGLPLPWRYRLMVGWVMRMAVWAARRQIYRRRFTFKSAEKISEGRVEDRVTDADIRAQAAMLRWLRFWLRGIGIIAEEDGCSIRCTLPRCYGNLVFVIDPLDGTKLYARGETGRSGVQIALGELVNDCVASILAAYVCEISSGLAYGFDPRSRGVVYCYAARFGWLLRVHSISLEGSDGNAHPIPSISLAPHGGRLLKEKFISRGTASDFRVDREGLIADMLEPLQLGGACGGTPFIGSGSPTVAAMTAMRGTAAGMVLKRHRSRIWDSAPFVGLMQALGFYSYIASEDGLWFETYQEPQCNYWLDKD